MTQEQLSGHIMAHSKDIAALWENSRATRERLERIEGQTQHVHRLATTIEGLTVQIEHQNRQVDKMLDSLKIQGMRIGKLEGEPASKWKALISQVVTLVVAALIGGALSNLL